MPPEYVLLSTELGGEKRFSSTIARRLGSLGALTKGDRGAADNGDLAKYNFETEEGRAALSLLLRRVRAGESVSGLDNPPQTLRDMGLLCKNREGGEEIRKEDEYNVPRFLNRVLALDVQRQNALFDAYSQLFDQTVAYAKQNGTFDEGVADIQALSVRLARPPRVVHADKLTGARTTHYTLEVDRHTERVAFAEAEKVRIQKGGAYFRHQKRGAFILAVPAGRHTDPGTGRTFQSFAVWRPEGARTNYVTEDDLARKYRVVAPRDAAPWWAEAHAAIPHVETAETHVIGGAILPLWQRLKTHRDARLKVVRVTADDGHRIVGIHIPPAKVWRVLRSIGVTRTLREPADIYRGVLEEGEEISLAGDLKLKKGRLHAESAVELVCADPYKFAHLRETGLINEQINWRQMFFVPADEVKGVQVIARLLDSYPVVAEESEEREGPEATDDCLPEAGAGRVIDLTEWVIAPARTDREEETAEGVTGSSEAATSPLAEQPPGGNAVTEAAGQEEMVFTAPTATAGRTGGGGERQPALCGSDETREPPRRSAATTRITPAAQMSFDFAEDAPAEAGGAATVAAPHGLALAA